MKFFIQSLVALFFNLLLLFLPLAILSFVFGFISREAIVGGLLLGVLFLFMAGFKPKIPSDD